VQPHFDNILAAHLDQWRAYGLDRQFRTIAAASGARIRIGDRELLNFSSNDYLGLASDPLLKGAAAEAIEKFGIGATASRLVCGNFSPYAELEQKLARFKNKPAAIVFGSGYAANVGVISALVGSGDIVIADKLCHASIIDGARMSGATLRVYPHKNLKRLEELLAGARRRQRNGRMAAWENGSAHQTAPTPPASQLPHSLIPPLPQSSADSPRVLLITETVFSMDGDLAPLREIVALKEKYGAWLMIDEAHATGLYAKHRRGIAEAMDVEDKIEITLGTLSKSFGCQGGYVVGSQTLIDFLRNKARALIYSTAMPPAIVAAAAVAVDFVMSDAGHRRRDQLWRNVSEMKNGLSALGIKNESRSPIIPVIIGTESAAVEISERLYERGIFVPAIRYPTVPKGRARVRVTVTAAHTKQDIQTFTAALKTCAGAIFNRDISIAVTVPKLKPDSPHSAALRLHRISLPDRGYFLTTATRNRIPIFANPKAAAIVIQTLRWLRDNGRIRLLGFVIMPDHVHVALALREGWSLDKVMQSFKRHTSRQIHQLLESAHLKENAMKGESGSSGSLWQDGYHDHLIRDPEDFESRLASIHANPIRKGLASHIEDYPHSTAHPDYRNDIDWNWLCGTPLEGRD
jgi:glycine C-acetyltransferase/8-amino-7-oxononanoate synthase